ncbi:RDD family protein [Paenibacillus sp. GCM10023250]|uniref:RDD family protein n=1 Tax=Paenibacillus sp. GCM10023250 TaxID=3252648 RepID=UPI00360CADAA
METRDAAGFWIRLGAVLLDAIIVGISLSIISFFFTGEFGEKQSTDMLSFLYSLLLPVLWNGYTIGKRICGIRIVRLRDGRAPGLGTMLMRNVVAGLVYVLTLGIAIIVSACMVGLREDKRALHDLIAGTQVVHAGR